MASIFRNLFLFILFVFSFTICPAQRFNTDAVQSFWQLIDRLEQDQPLTDSLWSAYYNLDGNKKYMEANRSDEQAAEHRRYLSLVFRPSMKDSLPALRVYKSTPGDDILSNLLYIKSHEQKLRSYTGDITGAGYLDQCIRLAKKYLPAGKSNPLPKDLVIYIHALTFDAAVQPPNMYFGLAIVFEFDQYQKGTIAAHEFHHQMRVSRELQKKVNYADSTSFSIIEQVNNEGTADLVDKTVALKNRQQIYGGDSEIRWLFDDAPRVMRQLDSSFQVNARSDDHRLSYRDFRKITLYSSGHIPGFYMANVIIRNGGEKELIAHSENPFYIFYLYNRLAAVDPLRPVLISSSTINYLKQLEERVY